MLSVICPIYNEEKYIARCIESIMTQDYPKDDLEVLFVDGMSTDRTREIIASYLPQCPYLRVLDNPHKIVPYAMNKGISEAKVFYLLWSFITLHCSYGWGSLMGILSLPFTKR